MMGIAEIVGAPASSRWLVIGQSDLPGAVCVGADAILKPAGQISFAPKTFDYALVIGGAVKLKRPIFLAHELLKIARKAVIISEIADARFQRWDLGTVSHFTGANLKLRPQTAILEVA